MAVASWLYALAAALALLYLSANATAFISQWIAVPSQMAAIALVGTLLLREQSQGYRGTWGCVLAFSVLSLIATFVWNAFHIDVQREVLSVPDLIYLLDYWILTIGFALAFRRAGGSFRRASVWLDLLTIAMLLLVGLWSWIWSPSLQAPVAGGISIAASSSYCFTIVCLMSMAAVACLQAPERRESAVFLWWLASAGIIDVTWEISWVSSWLTDRDLVGELYNYGDVLCFAGISTAVAVRPRLSAPAGESTFAERRVGSFLPIVAVLVAIAIIAASAGSTRSADAWVLVGLVVLCAMLIVSRQRSAQQELHALTRELARREADARLIELVRCARDSLLVVDTNQRVNFASLSTGALLGRDGELQGMPVRQLFGESNAEAISLLLERVRYTSPNPAVAELRVAPAGAQAPRLLRIVAIDELANPIICGIVLTVTDVTEQRALEREVLEIAARERMRISAEIHDGLGQELTGIAMLLSGVASSRQLTSASLKQDLQYISGRVSFAITEARGLAHGLSPLSTANGSLSCSLKRLIKEAKANNSMRLGLEIERGIEALQIDGICADHLYRIAQEALSNALRHSAASRIRVSLGQSDDLLVMSIRDDGVSFDELGAERAGLGLRLMEYRARVIGGSWRVAHHKDAGTTVEVAVPLVMLRRQSPAFT